MSLYLFGKIIQQDLHFLELLFNKLVAGISQFYYSEACVLRTSWDLHTLARLLKCPNACFQVISCNTVL